MPNDTSITIGPRPDLNPTGGLAHAGGSITTWITDHKWWLLAAMLLAILAVLLLANLRARAAARMIQRDALEVAHRDLAASLRLTVLPGAKRLWLTGTPRVAGYKLGRIRGGGPHVEAYCFAFAPRLLSRTQKAFVTPKAIVSALDVPDVHVSAVFPVHHRGFTFLAPDFHDATHAERWADALNLKPAATSAEFAEAFKAWMARVVDNIIAVDASLTAAQKRQFLREITSYASWEIARGTGGTPVATTQAPPPEPSATPGGPE